MTTEPTTQAEPMWCLCGDGFRDFAAMDDHIHGIHGDELAPAEARNASGLREALDAIDADAEVLGTGDGSWRAGTRFALDRILAALSGERP